MEADWLAQDPLLRRAKARTVEFAQRFPVPLRLVLSRCVSTNLAPCPFSEWIERLKEDWGAGTPMFLAATEARFLSEETDALGRRSWYDAMVERFEKGTLEPQARDLRMTGHGYAGERFAGRRVEEVGPPGQAREDFDLRRPAGSESGAIPPERRGPGGYGVVLLYDRHRKGLYRKELSGGFRLTTNNRMELMAAIVGLRALNTRCSVTLYSDSKLVTDTEFF